MCKTCFWITFIDDFESDKKHPFGRQQLDFCPVWVCISDSRCFRELFFVFLALLSSISSNFMTFPPNSDNELSGEE